MISFFSRLEARARAVDSLLCVGLDPHAELLPAPTAQAARDFCLQLIESTAPLAAAFKPNSAFFESLGPAGMHALAEVIAAVPAGIPVLLDAKRGDIASTARAYAAAVFDTLGADAVTLNPYLGQDTIEPFLENPANGVFLLCKTSNPGASDLQDLLVLPATGDREPRPLFETVALLAHQWNLQDNLGLVVGATQIEALARVRLIVPDMWMLAPGIGAQGGDLEKAMAAGLRADGLGLLVPVSRGISQAVDPGATAETLRARINRAREAFRRRSDAPPKTDVGSPPAGSDGPLPVVAVRAEERINRETIASQLIDTGCVKFGTFTLKSGLHSPIYIDLRRLASHPELLERVAAAYVPILETLTFDHLAALPYAALPIGTAIALQSGWPLIYPRKEAKGYGTGAAIEGVYQPGDRAVLIDDLTTTGGSKFEAIEKLEAGGLTVQDIVVLIDRGSGARELLEQAGYRFHAVFELTGLLANWRNGGRITENQLATVQDFLAGAGA